MQRQEMSQADLDNSPLPVKSHPTTTTETYVWVLYEFAQSAFEYITMQTVYPVFLTYVVFANGSSFPTTTTSTLLPDFTTLATGWFKSGTCKDAANCVIPWMNTYIRPSTFAINITSISVTIYIALLFILNSLVENTKFRKWVFLFFSLFGAFATCFAAIPRSGNLADYQITTAFIVVSSVFWSISSAIYNSYLPILVQNDSSLQYLLNEERSSPSIGGQGKIDRMNEKVTDRLSSFGNSAGFAASILIAGCTLLISTYLVVPATYTAGLLLSGCWWLLFTTPAIFFLTSRPGVSLSPDSNHIIHSVLSMCRVIVSAVKIPNTFIFLVLYFFLHNGLSAITYLAISIATSELAFSPLIFMIGLIIDPLFKLLGNFIFYFIKRWLRIRSKHLLFTLILAFLVVCGYGILGMTELPFGLKPQNVYVISNCTAYTVGTITYQTGGANCMYIPYEYYGFIAVSSILAGAIRTSSRTVFSQLVPNGVGFIFFGLLEVVGRGSAFIGPLIIGSLDVKYGTFRSGFVYLLIVFAIPLPLLYKLDVFKGRMDSERFAKELEKGIKHLGKREELSVAIEKSELDDKFDEQIGSNQIQKTLKINSPFDFDSAMEVNPDE